MEIRPVCRPQKRICSGKPSCVCKCPCGKARYRQPVRPKSYAPALVYIKPECPIESCTIYRKSYLPACTERARPLIPSCNLEVPHAKFAQATINKMSYPGWCNIRPPEPAAPCNNLSAGMGPMAEITTQRHDYVPKPFTKAEPVVPCNNIYTTNQPISDMTINRLSYQPVCTERATPIIPRSTMDRAEGAISNITIQKISYQPVPLPCKDDMPWANKGSYKVPCEPFAKDTIYKKSYLPSCIPRTEPFLPPSGENPLTSGTAFESGTIYRHSYKQNPCVSIPAPCIPSNNLSSCNARMSSDTINKMSYKPNCGYKPPSPVVPCTHNFLGGGPMAEITTTRHDYVPKPICPVGPIKKQDTMFISNEPISNMTINRLSYLPNCGIQVPKPIIPVGSMDKPTGKIENCTIQKLSYQPVGPVPKCDMPWAMKGSYQPPCSKMACNTIYNLSFNCPGEYIGDDCNCRCAYEEPSCVPQNCLNPILV